MDQKDQTPPFLIYLFVIICVVCLYFVGSGHTQATATPTPTPTPSDAVKAIMTAFPEPTRINRQDVIELVQEPIAIPEVFELSWLWTATARFFVSRLFPDIVGPAVFWEDAVFKKRIYVNGVPYPRDDLWELGLNGESNSVPLATGEHGNQDINRNLIMSASQFRGIIVSGTDVRFATLEMVNQPLTLQIQAQTADGEIVMKSFESPGRLQFIGRIESATQLVFDDYLGDKIVYQSPQYKTEIQPFIWRDYSDRYRYFRADDSTEDMILFDLNQGSIESKGSIYTHKNILLNGNQTFTIISDQYKTAIDFYGGNRTYTIDIAEEVFGITSPRYFDVQADNLATPGFRFDADSAIVDVTNIIKAHGLQFRAADTTDNATDLLEDMVEGEMRYWKPSGGEIGLAFDAGDELQVQWLTHYDNRVAGHNYPLSIRVTDELYLIRGHYITN